jgi:hypothetical protein
MAAPVEMVMVATNNSSSNSSKVQINPISKT